MKELNGFVGGRRQISLFILDKFKRIIQLLFPLKSSEKSPLLSRTT